MTRLIIARDAETDTDTILTYLEVAAGARTAAAYGERFAATLDRLIVHPRSGAPRPAQRHTALDLSLSLLADSVLRLQ